MNNNIIPPYLDSSLSVDERVDDLVSRMTVEEKISQMLHQAPPIDRLGIPGYNWWNECLHGVARAGTATVFPQAIGMAASWNPDLIYRVASAIADEARGMFNHKGRVHVHGIYEGLTFWTPNINIFRDPRWGRGQETYGEDPKLTGELAVKFIKGLQGNHPRYLKTIATPKHFAVHSGPEADRHQFNAKATWRDMRTTYLPAFQAAVQSGEAYSVMGAYNRTNGEACCASETLLQQVLREEWGFDGYVVSDCGAISDIYRHHHLVETAAEAAALSVKNGCDLNCGETFAFLTEAFAKGLITEAIIDRSVKRLFKARFLLGLFDAIEEVPFNLIPASVVNCPAHQALALEMARESMVLLKNEGILPLDRQHLQSIAVIGPKADDELVLRGNYYGDPAQAYTIYAGIQERAGDKISVRYAPGCKLASMDTTLFAEAISIAQECDVTIAVLGLSQLFEGEEGQEEGNQPGERSLGDRTTLGLPGVQEDLLKALVATGKPVILVLLNGSAVAINWAQGNVPAILEAWYPGQAGGLAVGEVLFGDTNPSGRLPVTFYQSEADLPAFEDYAMEERTYRYFSGKCLYPFGFGLSYSTFEYSQLRMMAPLLQKDETQVVTCVVTNTSDVCGDEVVQLYVSDVKASVPVPNYTLVAFEKIHLRPGQSKTLRFEITPEQLQCYSDDGEAFNEPGEFKIFIGGHAPTIKGCVADVTPLLNTSFTVVEQLVETKQLFMPSSAAFVELPYLLYQPDGFQAGRNGLYPLLLFLHGMGERGNDLCSIRIHGLPRVIENGGRFPFFIVSPQCPKTTVWSEISDSVNALIDQLMVDYPIDEDRIWITGLSMGGFGTWKMLVDYPERFAAAAPICGGLMDARYQPEILKRLLRIPIWNFHGDMDPVVPVESSDFLVERIREYGGKIRYTRYPGLMHDSWTPTYDNPALYRWLMSKRLEQ
ncbi:MAG: glycoside hydrolase family 3 C-terminal domain-containing protein [Anaerolineae bacterium]|nr:glycoside hydrolase family 3 C-terminal domain-containing protein [Anaerolineae bacterium]